MKNYDYLSLSVIRWETMTSVRSDNIVDSYKRMSLSEEEHRRIVGDMRERLSTLETRSFWFMNFSFMLNIFLFVGLYFPEKDISILEISSKNLASVKEVSVFVAYSVLVASSFLSMNTGILINALRKMYIWDRGEEESRVVEGLVPGNMFGVDRTPGFFRGQLFLVSPVSVIFPFMGIFLILFVVFYIGIYLFSQIYIIFNIIKYPSIDGVFNYVVIVYAICCTLCFVAMVVLQKVPLPYIQYYNNFYDYVENIGGKVFEDYCCSSVLWRERPKFRKFLLLSFLMFSVCSGAILYVLGISGNLEYFYVGAIIFGVFVFSYIVAKVAWNLRLRKFISDNAHSLDSFDAKHFAEWKLQEKHKVPE
ncbi:hypothetical protein [Thalassospira sp.]|uniref:hypothetical protein n=1 Tax=Thalassospira sp. TaxID=1912094 RepID=UPI0025F2D78A|nr:hypothetical protein [Thalassospira sp.]